MVQYQWWHEYGRRPEVKPDETLVPVPPKSAEQLRKEKETTPGYQFVSIRVKDGRYFEPAVASEGCIIQVQGHKDVPFTEAEVKSVEVNDKHWNFRRQPGDRPKK